MSNENWKMDQIFLAFSEYLSLTTQDKSTVEISQKFVAFSEYTEYKISGDLDFDLECKKKFQEK